MDSGPDSPLINSPNINSVLKPPKPRVPLKDLMAAVPEEDNTAARKRRVSFANVNKIKEFSAGAESMVVCQTPAYEEPFSVSSDSSYPSGIDGWTPAKVQISVHGKPPIYPEKENLSVQSLRMSTGMNLTSVVGNLVRSSRYSDLTGVANSHETCIDHQTRFSIGMDLTSIAGHPSPASRYSDSGMNLVMDHSNQVLVDQRTRFSMGMDFTNVVGNSTQNTRYSINGMDLTEAVNPQQTFPDQRSARFSVGMDLTNVVDNTMRYSCNEMDLTEATNPSCYKKQCCEGGFSANVSMNDSDALELTEVVHGVQFSAVSPKYKISDAGLTENVLYSVNNTRHSVNSMNMTSAAMNMTSAAGSHLSTVRRKSSRYSLVNMDLTEAINNSCDDLEFTQAIGDPRIKAGSTRNSVYEMDLAESLIDEGETRLSLENMNHTSVVGEPLEYSADTESIMNMTKNKSNNLDPPIYDKENVLPIQSFKLIDASTMLSHESPMYRYIDSKRSNMSLCTTAHEALSEVTIQHPIDNENKDNHIQNTMSLNNSQNIKHTICEQLLNESQHKTESAPDEFKEDLPSCHVNRSMVTQTDSKGKSEDEDFEGVKINQSMVTQTDSKGKSEDEDFEGVKINQSMVTQTDSKGKSEDEDFEGVKNSSQSISLSPVQKEGVVENISNEKETSCVNNKTFSKVEFSVCHLSNTNNKNEKQFSLNASNCNVTEQKQGDALNNSPNLDQSYMKDLNLNKTRSSVDNLEHDSSRRGDATAQQHNSSTENLTLKNESKNKEPINEQILNEDAMDVSITDNSGLEKHNSNDTKESHSYEIRKLETTVSCPEVVCSLNGSVMNMSIGDCSLIKEVKDVENIYDQVKLNNDSCGKDVSVPVTDYVINRQANNTLNFTLEENHLEMVENITAKDQSIDSNVPSNTSLNLSSRSVLCNKNITMTRGSKSLIITPDTSLEISNKDSMILENEASSIQTTSVTTKSHVNVCVLHQSENNLKHVRSSQQSEESQEKRGKRSFEAALEPENDTEESPIKQLCMSREDPSTEYELLSNATAPSFLMDTVAASNVTLSCVDQHETTAVVHQFTPKPASLTERNVSFTPVSESTCETKQEFSLRMDDSLIRNMSENPLRNEVIDLCESSFDATTTEVRDLINNSRYKTRNIFDDEIVTKQSESFNCLTKTDSSGFTDRSFDHGQLDHLQRPCLIKEPYSNNSLNMDDANGTNVLEREVENRGTHSLPPLHHMESSSRRKREKLRTLRNNSYAADFIPNLVGIHFSIDSFGNVKDLTYYSICTGGDTVIGEYLLKQARNCVLPERGSDLILQFQSTNKSYLACLARSLNIICKYHNGSIKGDILTLEVASCKHHFWTFIDVNIKHPQYINQTDITISKQKIGELKLSHVRKIFNTIEKNQDQLLNFAKAITELQYNN